MIHTYIEQYRVSRIVYLIGFHCNPHFKMYNVTVTRYSYRCYKVVHAWQEKSCARSITESLRLDVLKSIYGTITEAGILGIYTAQYVDL